MNLNPDLDRPVFSVCQFYIHRTFKRECTNVLLTEAAKVAVRCINSIDSKAGVVSRIIITDGGDRIVFEWKYVLGIVFPPNLKGMRLNVTPSKSGPDEALENLPPSDFSGDRGVLLVRSASR